MVTLPTSQVVKGPTSCVKRLNLADFSRHLRRIEVRFRMLAYNTTKFVIQFSPTSLLHAVKLSRYCGFSLTQRQWKTAVKSKLISRPSLPVER